MCIVRHMIKLPAGALMLAPMVELSNRPLRTLMEQWGGCDRYHTEMCSASAWLANTAYEKWFLDTQPAPEKTVVQFYATKVDDIPRAAARLRDEKVAEGAPLAGIDINFGCAAPHIERSGGGVYWMKQADASAELVAKTRQAIPELALSAKLRLGYEDSPQDLLAYCKLLADAGLDYLTLHPRLKNEKFRRQSRWSNVRFLAENLPIPVIGNGDIRSPEDYRKAMQNWQPAGIMLGREAIRRPWLFALIRGKEQNPDFSLHIDMEACALQMINLIRQHLPTVFHISRARRFFLYFSENLSFGHHLCFKIQNALSLSAMEDHLRSYFREVPAEKIRHER